MNLKSLNMKIYKILTNFLNLKKINYCEKIFKYATHFGEP